MGRSRAPFSVEAQVPQQALQAGTALCPRHWLPLAIQSIPCLSQEHLHTLPSVGVQWELETPGLLACHRVREQSGQVLNSMVTLPAGWVSNSSAETVYLPLVSCLLWECQEGCQWHCKWEISVAPSGRELLPNTHWGWVYRDQAWATSGTPRTKGSGAVRRAAVARTQVLGGEALF